MKSTLFTALLFLFVASNVESQTISGVLWEDINGNGQQDGGEPGLGNHTFSITYDTNGNNTLDGGDTVLPPISTDGTGNYSYSYVNGTGYYFIDFQIPQSPTPSYPTMYLQGNSATDSDIEPTSGIVTVDVTSVGQNLLNIDGGFFFAAIVEGTVWEDINGDGDDPDGMFLSVNVTVELYSVDNSMTAVDVFGVTFPPVSTANDYTFMDIPPGTYEVRFSQPANHFFTIADNNGNDDLSDGPGDSDAVYFGAFGASDGHSHEFELISGEIDEVIDAGYFQAAEVNGMVWEDINGDGDDPDGTPLGVNVDVELFDIINNATAVDVFGANIPLASTSSTYTFTDIPPGTYEVRFSQPADHFFTIADNNGNDDLSDGPGDSDAVYSGTFGASDGHSHEFDLSSNELDELVDAGYFQPAEINGFVWEDGNADGLNNSGAPSFDNPLPGVNIELWDATTNMQALDAFNMPLMTVSNGNAGNNYTLEDIPPGEYVVKFTTPTGPDQHYLTREHINNNVSDLDDDADDTDSDASPDDGTGFGSSDNGTSHSFVLISDETDEDVDAGFFVPGIIEGFVWEDINRNGLVDVGEPGIVDPVTVDLIDLATNAIAVDVINGGTFSTVVSGGGDPNYIFTYVIPGNYHVIFNTPSGAVQYYLTIDDVTGANTDAADDGAPDDSDAVPTVAMDLTSNGQSHDFNIESNETPDENIDAGYFRAAEINGYVWEDLNGNGEQEGAEPALAGIIVELWNITQGTQVLDLVTNAPITAVSNGGDFSYTFMNVPPSPENDEYVVRFTANPGANDYYLTIPDFSGAATDAADDGVVNDSDAVGGPAPQLFMMGDSHTFEIESFEMDEEVDAGFFELCTVGNYVWEDKDAMGIQAGNPPLENIMVQLFNADGTPAFDRDGNLLMANTDAAGMYLFEFIPPGDYYVTFSDPAGLAFVTTEDYSGGNTDGADAADDSDAVPAGGGLSNTGDSHIFNLRSSEEELDIDAGFWYMSTLGDLVWIDNDEDGFFTTGEGVIPGVTLELYDDMDVLIATAVTDGNGIYEFTDVPPGMYYILIPSLNFNAGAPLDGFASTPMVWPVDVDVDNDNNGTYDAGAMTIMSDVFEILSRMEPDVEDADMSTNLTIDFGVYIAPCAVLITTPSFLNCQDAHEFPICELEILNDFCSELPNFPNPQGPGTLCSNGGAPHNTDWFSFIAGSEVIELEIVPTNCTSPGGAASGLQAGIYGDCAFTQEIICQGQCQLGTFSLLGTTFVPGQQYYFFLDGCNGSVCSYDINVLQGEQPFLIPQPTDITCPLPDCNIASQPVQICLGAENILFSLVDLDIEIDYYWTIDPAPAEYPGGLHPDHPDLADNSTYQASWNFNEEGIFTISVFATNGCDTNDPISIQVEVTKLPDEFFMPIMVCEGDFIWTFNTNEDPNVDGIIGWLGPGIVRPPFEDEFTVVYNAENDLGCVYDQYVDVEVLFNPLEVELYPYICAGESINIAGVEISSTSPLPVNIQTDSYEGCDSTIFVFYTMVELPGQIVLFDCNAGLLNIEFNTGADLTVFDNITYIWENTTDPTQTFVADANNDDGILTINQSGTYELTIEVVIEAIEGVTEETVCSFTYNTIVVNYDDYGATPVTVVGTWDTSLCQDELIQTYEILNVAGEQYQWSYPADVTVITENMTTLELDWTGSAGGEVCVNSLNSCGPGPEFCQTIELVADPIPSIAPISTVCRNGVTTVVSNGIMDPGYTYTWNFDGGVVQNSPPQDINGPGPFDVLWPTAGTKSVTLTVSQMGCESAPTMAEVEVINRILAPQLMCASTSTDITLSWTAIVSATGYEVTYEYPAGNFVVVNLTAAELMINIPGLIDGVAIPFSVITTSNDACGNSLPAMTTCVTQNCVQPIITLAPMSSDICLDGTEVPFDFIPDINDVDVTGDEFGVYTGNGITDPSAGTFDPAVAGVGTHVITYTYNEPSATCVTTAQATVTVYDIPSAAFTLSMNTICITDNVTMNYTGGSNPEMFIPDFGDPTDVVATGSGGIYTLSWLTPGVKTVSLVVVRDNCTSVRVTMMVTVDEELDDIDVKCDAITSTSVSFDWNDVASDYEVTYNGTTTVQNNSDFFVGGLSPGDAITIDVVAISPNSCSNKSDSETCIASDCVMSTVMFNIPNTTICLSQTNLIDIDAILQIPTTDGMETWTGTGVDPSTGVFDPTLAGIGSWTIDYVYQELNCSYSGSLTINVIADPVPTFTALSNICETESLIVTYTGTTGVGYTYTWDFDGATVLSGSNEGPYEIMWNTPGTYSVSVSTNNGICEQSSPEQSVIVEPGLPDPMIDCTPGLNDILFTWDADPCAMSFDIYIDNVLVTTQTDNMYFVNGLVEGQMVDFAIQVNSSCACPGELYSLECTASPCPTISIDLSGNDQDYCILEIEGILVLNAAVAGSTGSGAGVWSGSGINPDGSWNAALVVPGDYMFTYTFTEDGCDFNENVTVTIYEQPTADVIITNPPCPIDNATGSIIINALGGGGNYTFFVDGEMTAGNSVSNLVGGPHELLVVDSEGCQNVVAFNIDLAAELSLLLSGDEVLEEGDPGQIEVMTNVDPLAIDSIVWTVNGVVVDCTSPDCFILNFIASENQVFCATMYYNSACEISDCISVSIMPDIPQVYIPTAFSPNGDGINEKFNIGTNPGVLEVTKMSIYDRWGELLWQSDGPFSPNDLDEGWDGKFRGEDVQPGVYVYVIAVKTTFADNEIYAGDITVLR